MNRIQSFIHMLHQLWLADALTMDEFMDVIDPLMVRYKVNWMERMSYVDDHGRLNLDSRDAPEVFYYEMNDCSKDVYAVFETVCLHTMDFSNLEERRTAA